MNKDTIQNITWCLQTLVKSDIEAKNEILNFADRVKIITIAKSVVGYETTKRSESFSDALHVLKMLSDNANDKILGLIGCGDMPSLLINWHAEYYNDLKIHIIVLRIIANLLTSSKTDII